MTDQLGQEPAFPADAFAVHKDLPRDLILKLESCRGLTKREWFAGMAMIGLIQKPVDAIVEGEFSERISQAAFKLADAMLQEGEK